MASYEKLTLDRFQSSLKEGKYASLTGARRAIGKTTSWSGKERASAQELANKHFGSTDDSKPSVKKTTVKKASAKKISAKKLSAKTASAPKTSAKKNAAARRTPMPTVGVTTQTGSTGPTRAATAFDHRIAAHETLAFVHNARAELQAFRTLSTSFDTAKHEKELFTILENAIGHMSASAKGGSIPAIAVTSAVPRIEVPKADGAFADKPRSVKDLAADVGNDEPQSVAQVQQNGTIEEEDLTDAERNARAMLQGNPPDLGLPRPSQI